MPPRPIRWPLLVLLVFACAVSGCLSGGGIPHTDRLVITRDKSLNELSLKTKSERPLIQALPGATLIDPAVSPDGARIAYVQLLTPVVVPGQNTDLGSDLYVANADGSGPALAVQHSARNEQVLSPAWLPDGSGLLFSVQRFANRRTVTTIERLDLASGARTALVQDAFQPAVSPDGATIAFLRLEPDFTQSLWTANADGTSERRLAGEEQQLVSFQSPRFSLDGRSLATGAAALGALPGATPNVRRLAVNSEGAGGPTLRVSRNGLPEDIWLIDLTTGQFRRIAKLSLDSPSLSWSSDGRRLFAYGDRGLYAIDPGKASAKRVAEGQFHGQAAWLSAE